MARGGFQSRIDQMRGVGPRVSYLGTPEHDCERTASEIQGRPLPFGDSPPCRRDGTALVGTEIALISGLVASPRVTPVSARRPVAPTAPIRCHRGPCTSLRV
jgi:hypothetical protein